ncbi:MAG: hypothetical protein K1X53_13875 [Candidatus Sumerlaeaceae bacterium]|nr:hypothetical protein [Candidatus Sumerlaeaceae bacterium]
MTEVLGGALLAAAAALALWEHRSHKFRDEDPWLLTRRRYRRRMLVSFVLVVIGCLLVGEVRGYIPTTNSSVLILWLLGVMTLSISLLILAAVDLADTAQAASRQSMEDIRQAIEEQQRKAQSGESQSPPEP